MILIQEYYEPESVDRLLEIKKALTINLNNKNITEIYLLNEKEYPYITELAASFNKLTQIVIGKRCTFKTAFDFSNQTKFFGLIIIVSNNDISIDDNDNTYLTIENELKQVNTVLALSRYSLINNKLELFNRPDSQDTWIYKSPIIVPKDSDFYFGLNGSDNRIAYLLSNYYIVKNKAKSIITVHHHKSNIRNNKSTVLGPYLMLDLV